MTYDWRLNRAKRIAAHQAAMADLAARDMALAEQRRLNAREHAANLAALSSPNTPHQRAETGALQLQKDIADYELALIAMANDSRLPNVIRSSAHILRSVFQLLNA